MARESCGVLSGAVAISRSEIESVIIWVLRRVEQTIQNISGADARVLLMFAVEVAKLRSRWGDTWWKPDKKMLRREGWPALQDAVLAVFAQRGDGSYSLMRKFDGSGPQILFVEAFARLVAVAGSVAVAVEYYQRAKKHELGVDAAVLLAAMKGLRPKGVEDSYHRLCKVTAATFYKRGKGLWEPEFVRTAETENGGEDGRGAGERVPSKTLDAVEMDLNSQVAITLGQRFAANRSASELYALALEGKLDIVPRAIADDLMDQRKHRRIIREKTPLVKGEEEFRVIFESAKAPADISQPLMELLNDTPEIAECLEILISPENRKEMANKLGITPKTVTNRRKRAEKTVREYFQNK